MKKSGKQKILDNKERFIRDIGIKKEDSKKPSFLIPDSIRGYKAVFADFKKSISQKPKTTISLSAILVVSLLFGGAFLLNSVITKKIDSASLIKSGQTIQISQNIVAGKNQETVKWLSIVDKTKLNGAERYLKLPESARNVKVKTFKTQVELQEYIDNQKEQNNKQLSVADRQTIAGIYPGGFLAQASNRVSSFAKLFMADAVEGLENAAEVIVEAQESAPVENTDQGKVVDLEEKIEAKEEKKEEKQEAKEEKKAEKEQTSQEVDETETPVEETEEEVVVPEETEEVGEIIEEIPAEEIITSVEEEQTEVIDIIDNEPIVETTSPSTDSEIVTTPDESLGHSLTDEAIIKTTSDGDETVLVEEEEDEIIAVEFETESPVINEEETSSGKIVTVALEDPTIDEQTTVTDVVAYTTIPEIYKLEDGNKIQIKWKNQGDANVQFSYHDLDDNGLIDYLEWRVPHLSEQIFEIIFISKAFQLDSDKNIIADIYDLVGTQDQTYANLLDGQYIRVTFDQLLENHNDITIYAKANSPSQIEVYPVDANGNAESVPIITFDNLQAYQKYRMILDTLPYPTDVFDLKIIGDIDIDYIVDPASTYYWVGGDGDSVNDMTNWSTSNPSACNDGGGNATEVPGSDDTAVFDADCDSSANIDLNWSLAGINLNSGYIGTVDQNDGYTLTVGTSDFTMAGGTFAGGNSTIDLNDAFTISAGDFTSTSGTMTIAGSLTQTGSPSFTHNSGTVTFDTLSSATVSASAFTFNKVIISKTSSVSVTSYTFTIASGTTIPLGDSPTTTMINTGSGSGSITNNGTITAGTGTWTVSSDGTFTNNGTITTSITAYTHSTGAFVNNSTWTNSSLNTINIDGSYTHGNSASTFTCNTSCTANFGTSLTATTGGAAFLANHATITFDELTTATIDASSVTFNAVVINKSASVSVTTYTFTIASGTTLPLGNSASTTMQNTGSGSGSITNNGVITVGTGTWTVTIDGTFTNSGTITTSATAISFANVSGSIVNNSTWTNSSLNTFNTENSYTHNNAAATLTCNTSCTATIGTSLSVTTGGAAFLANHSTITFDTISTATINTSDFTFNAAAISKNANGSTTNYTLTIASGTTIPLGNSPTLAMNNSGSGSGSITNNGTITVGTGTWTVTTDGTFTNNGTIQTKSATRTQSGGSYSNASGSTVIFTGDADSASDSFTLTGLGTSYHHLTINSTDGLSDAFNQGAGVTVGGDFTLTAGTYDLSSYTLAVTGTTAVASGANYQLQGGETSPTPTLASGSIVTYDGSSSYTLNNWGYHHLTLNGAGTWTLANAIDTAGNITITAGTLDVSAAGCSSASCSINLEGNWDNDGTFTARTGTVTLDGTNQSVSGTTTFYNLTKTESSDNSTSETLTFEAGVEQTITGTWTLDGRDANDQILLVSSSPGSQWDIDPQSTRTLDFITVTDSNNTNATAIECSSDCTDGGAGDTNTNWNFISNTAPSISAGPSDASSYSSSPTNAGSSITMTATASDGESDQYYLAICKTNSVTAVNSSAPTCAGGNWCISSSTASGAQASCSYTTLTGDSESNDWYAFVCDNNSGSLCSSASQGSGNSGSPFSVNHRPSFSAIANTSGYVSEGSAVVFTTTASDSDTDGTADTTTLYVCKANDFDGSTCGAGGTWCYSSASSSNPTCSYTVSGLSDGAKTYYGFIIDNHSFASSDNPRSSTFNIDSTAPTTTADGGAYTFGTWTTSNVSMTLSCSDGSGVGCSYIKYCSDTSNSCTPTTTYSSAVTISTNGTSYIRYRSTDSSGNTETTGSSTININQAPTFSAISVSPEIGGVGSSISFLSTASDADADNITMYVCKANDFTGSACGAGGSWCTSSAGSSDPTCSYTVVLGDGSATQNYYANIIDARSTQSASNPRSGTFETSIAAPTASGFSPASGATTSTNPLIAFSLDVVGDCRLSLSDESYDDMSGDTDCTGDNSTSMSCRIPDQIPGTYTVYVACQSYLGNKNTTSDNFALTYAMTQSFGGGNSPAGGAENISVAQSPSPIVNIIENIVDALTPSQPIAQITYPPIEESVPQETPIAFQKPSDIIKPILPENFVLLPTPKSILSLINKFPQIEQTLDKLGIAKSATLPTLKSIVLNLPALNTFVTGIKSDVRLADLPKEELEKIPTNFVFVSTAKNTINLNTKLVFADSGEPVQTVELINNQLINLVLRTSESAEDITGSVILKSVKTGKLDKPSKSVLAASLLGALDNEDEERVIDKVLVLDTFVYKKVSEGVYTASLQAPSVAGSYEIKTEINYIDNTKETLSTEAIIDPEGYIYSKTFDGQETRIKGAVVSIYKQNIETQKYELWNAKDYLQENPQTTDVTGKYSFLVPEGSYYIKVESKSFKTYIGEPFIVQQGAPVHENIELESGNLLSGILSPSAIALAIAVILLISIIITFIGIIKVKSLNIQKIN